MTYVDDAEDLFRSINPDSDEYSIQNGKLKFSSTAFDDRYMKPSVDRSAMRADPKEARRHPDAGVTKVNTGDVRRTCSVPIIINGKVSGDHAADVVHRPIVNEENLPDNPAHSQIECNPSIESGSRFKKLKAALARLANAHGFVEPPKSA